MSYSAASSYQPLGSAANIVIKLAAMSSAVIALSPVALELSDFDFVSGATPDNYSYYGKPLDTYSIADSLPREILDNVYSMLPEGSAVNPDFIAPERYGSIDIDDELNGASHATVSVTFLNEGAGYRNSLGYIIYPTDNPPTDKELVDQHWIIFPNSSKYSAGRMTEGDTLDLNIQVQTGQTIAFFVIPNGWGYAGSYNNLNSLGNWNTPFYSIPALNPESTQTNRRHSVAFVDSVNQLLVFGFEDLYRPIGDNDFNDLLFTVNVTPFTAVDGVNADGSISSRYESLVQIDDPQLRLTSVYPAADSYATLAFEDRWPLQGDYDFNDVVWRYRIHETLNGQRQLLGISAEFILQAMGAGFHNGFAIHLPNVDPSLIDSVQLLRNNEPVDHTVLQQHGDQAVIVVSEDLRAQLIEDGLLTDNCEFFRTQNHCLEQQSSETVRYELSISLTEAVDREDIGYPPYDSFIFATPGYHHGNFSDQPPGMGWQTHLKQFPGTSLIQSSLYGSNEDASGGEKYFVNSNHFPWAINIGHSWQHPIEKTDISHAYPAFATWVETSAEQNNDWYQPHNAEASRVVTTP